jgi:hypothetical protein
MASHGLLKFPKLRTPSVGVSLSAPPTPRRPKLGIYTQDEKGLSSTEQLICQTARHRHAAEVRKNGDFARHFGCGASLKTEVRGHVES